MRPLDLLPAAWAAAALLALGACGGDASFETETGVEASASDGLAPVFDAVASAPWTTRHRGIRRFTSTYGSSLLSYREEVATDGEGRFSLEPVELLSAAPGGAATFFLLQGLREGFLFRYRDFAVRDLAAFHASYVATDLDSAVDVAGRACQRYLVHRADGGDRWTISVDAETGLVLAYERRDERDELLARLEYESFEPDPDLSDVVWYVSPNQETTLDPSADLAAQLDFEPHVPTILPPGFVLAKAATLVDPEGRTWLDLVHTDGVEPLFFLHVGAAPDAASMPEDARLGDEVVVHEMAPATVVQGTLRGREVLVVGTVGIDPLLDLIESALP